MIIINQIALFVRCVFYLATQWWLFHRKLFQLTVSSSWSRWSCSSSFDESSRIEKEIRQNVDDEAADEFKAGFKAERERQKKIQGMPQEEAIGYIDSEEGILKSAEDKVSKGVIQIKEDAPAGVRTGMRTKPAGSQFNWPGY